MQMILKHFRMTDFSHGKIPVFLINLDRSTERLARMSDQFAMLNLAFERVPAVDGTSLSNEEIAEWNSPETVRLTGRQMSRSEIGCTLSHLEVYRRMADRGIARALICEDDVILPDDIGAIWEKVADKAWDILLLHHRNTGFKKFSTVRVDMNDRLIEFKRHAPSTAAYLLTLEAAKRLQEVAANRMMLADTLTGESRLTSLKVCGLLRSPVRLSGAPSTIER